MVPEGWLLLTDYSSKYRISVSTLRRRIKTNQIAFRFDSGKYFLMDSPPPAHLEAEEKPGLQNNLFDFQADSAPSRDEYREKPERMESAPSSQTQLLSELKKAYMSILQEKEEVILQLKEEIADLQTLVRVLEEDNERLRTGRVR